MRLLTWSASLLCLLACAEEKRAPVAPRPGYNVTETASGPMREVLQRDVDPDDLLRCNIREEDCQVRVFDATTAARGTEGPRPPVSVATASEFGQLLDEMGGGGSAPGDGLRLLALLQLVSPALLSATGGEGEDDFEGLLAVYFFASKEVVVIDHGKPLNTIEATLTLSHEFVHALQDHQHDLAVLSSLAMSTDEHQGHLGLVEGEAEVYASLVVTGEVNESRGSWRTLRNAVIDAAVSSEAPFFVGDLHFPYTIGNEFVTFAWLAGGDEAVAGLYGAVPRSSRQILAGFEAEEPQGGWVEPITDTIDAVVADGFEIVLEDSFGAFTLHLFLEVLAREAGARSVRLPEESFALDLRGDHVVAFERDGSMVAVWRLRFEPHVYRALVAAEIEAAASGAFELREIGSDLFVFAGEDSAVLADFVAGFELPGPGGAATARVPGLARPRLPVWRPARPAFIH